MGFLNRNICYEVQVQNHGHWTIAEIENSEKSAKKLALALVEANQSQAVRILKEIDDEEPQVIFEQRCTGRPEKPVTIATIETAPLCSTIDDLYTFRARQAAGRLFRQYLDREGLTVFEIMHSHWRIRAFAAEENLALQGIHRVAGIQARADEVDYKAQVDFFFRCLNDLRDLMRDLVEEKKVPALVKVLKDKGYNALLKRLSKVYGKEARPRAAGIPLAAYLSDHGDWGRKIDAVITLLVVDDTNFEDLADELVAEIIDGASAAKEILGPQKDLGSALLALSKLSQGRLSIRSKRMQSSPLAHLNKLMADRTMPRAQEVLLNRVAKGLGGVKPLTKETDVEDQQTFRDIVTALMDNAGFAGGPMIAEAVTKRSRIIFGTEGRDLPSDRAISICYSMFKTKAARLGYLLALSGSGFGAEHRAQILKQIFDLVQGLNSFSDIISVKPGSEAFDKAARQFTDRVESSVLPADIGHLIRKKLDSLLGLQQKGKADKVIAKDPLAGQEFPEDLPVTELEQGLIRRKVRKGTYVFREGEPGDEAYLVASGTVDILIDQGGKPTLIAQVERGEIFGEMALIDHEPRMASAKATSNCVLTVIPIEDFERRLKDIMEQDRMIPRLLELFAQRLRQRSNRLTLE